MVPEPDVNPPPTHLRPHLRLWVIIFLIALISRLFFLEAGRQLPVFWDARIYVSSAIGLLGYIDRDDPYARGETTQNDFTQYYERYLAGEDINWLYYQPPTLTEAQTYLFYSGPVYPAIMAAIFTLPWSNDFQAVRWFNAVIDSLSLVIIAMAAFLIWRSRRAAIIAAAVQLLYFPLVITCGILALETISSFFIAVLIFCVVRHHQTENPRWAAAAGAAAGILFLTKPTGAMVSLPVVIFWLIIYIRRRQDLWRTLLWYIFPFLLLAIPWTAFTSNHYGRLAVRDPEYAVANFRSSSSVNFEGYDLDYTDPDFWTYSVADRILADPAGYGNLLLKKLIRLWWTPHDEFWQGPRWYETTAHRLLVMAGLIALAALPFWRRKILVFPALVIGYYTGIHTILHAVPRYNFNALPAVFLMLPAMVLMAPEAVERLRKSKRSALVLVGLAVVAVVINSSAVSTRLLRFVPALVPLGLTIAVLAAITYTAIYMFTGPSVSTRSRWWLWAPFVLLSLTSITGWTRPQLQEWSTPVTDAKTRLVTEISMPPGFRAGPQDEVLLSVDLVSAGDSTVPLEVNVAGVAYRFNDGGPQIDKNYRIKGSYPAFDDIMSLKPQRMRWYRVMRIAPEAVNAAVMRNGKLVVIIGINDPQYTGPGFRLYGDLIDDQAGVATVPSFSHTSIERFKEWGDRRVYESYRLESAAARSYILREGTVVDGDLSPDCGVQRGRFRIYVTVSPADFTHHYF
jgi:4-amino-4-deoxy-L-arabinose transferase-like glycosyltransferase